MHTKKTKAAPKRAELKRVNIRITGKAYAKLRKMAKQEGRTILSLVDHILGV